MAEEWARFWAILETQIGLMKERMMKLLKLITPLINWPNDKRQSLQSGHLFQPKKKKTTGINYLLFMTRTNMCDLV